MYHRLLIPRCSFCGVEKAPGHTWTRADGWAGFACTKPECQAKGRAERTAQQRARRHLRQQPNQQQAGQGSLFEGGEDAGPER